MISFNSLIIKINSSRPIYSNRYSSTIYICKRLTPNKDYSLSTHLRRLRNRDYPSTINVSVSLHNKDLPSKQDHAIEITPLYHLNKRSTSAIYITPLPPKQALPYALELE